MQFRNLRGMHSEPSVPTCAREAPLLAALPKRQAFQNGSASQSESDTTNQGPCTLPKSLDSCRHTPDVF